MEKIIATVERPNGEIEQVDMMARGWISMNQRMFETMKKATAEAGKGNVLKIEWTHTKTNYAELAKKYNDFMNEGGGGYIPDMEKHPNFRRWEETEVFA